MSTVDRHNKKRHKPTLKKAGLSFYSLSTKREPPLAYARKSTKVKEDTISLKLCRGCFMPYTHKRGNVIPVLDMASKGKPPSVLIGGAIAGVTIVLGLFIPIVPVTAQEECTEMETKQESYVEVETRTEAYTDVERKREQYVDIETATEAYTVIEEMSESLYSINSRTLEGGEYTGWTSYIPAGRNVEFVMQASDTLDTYIAAQSTYEANGNSYGAPISEQAEVRYGFHTSIADNYYYLIQNPHDGVFGLGDQSVGIYSATATVTWQEEVVRYRDVDTPVTKYRTVEVPVTKYKEVDVPVTKYKDVEVPVTKYKDVTKNISILEMMTRPAS